MSSREKVTFSHSDLEIVLSRMREVSGTRNNVELAGAMSLNANTLQKAISRGKIPDKHLLEFCSHYGVTVDWLRTGQKSINDKMSQASCCIPPDKRQLIEAVIEVLNSGTMHAKALEQNIMAFHHAVKVEKRQAESESKMDALNKRVEQLEAELKNDRDQDPRPPAGSSGEEAI